VHKGDVDSWGVRPMVLVLAALAGTGFLAVFAAAASAVTCWD
jgi:hypothetical protein